MGCLVAKSTISYYEGEILKVSSTIEQIKVQIDDRKQLQALNDLQEENELGYLAYQEQLRAEFNISKLKELFQINDDLETPSEHYLSNLSAYSKLKSLQTTYESKLVHQLYSFFENLQTMNAEKKSSIKQQISDIEKKGIKKSSSSERLLHSLTQKLSDVENESSLEKHVKTFVKRSELDKEIALLERIYRFKGHIAREKVNKMAKSDGENAVKDLKNELKEANKTLAALKAEEQKCKQIIKQKKKDIRKKEEILQKLTEDKQEIENEIMDKPDVVKQFDELLLNVNEKELALKDLQSEVSKNEKKLNELKATKDLEELKHKSKQIKRQIEVAEQEVDELKALKMKRIQDKIRFKHQELENKSKKIQDLKLNIKSNQEALARAEEDTKFQIKKQVIIRLIRSIKRLRSGFFRSWKRIWLQSKVVLPFIDDNSNDSLRYCFWEAIKLYEFFDMFIQEKARSDKARIHNKKLPKTTEKYLHIYMKRLYKSTNECEKEIMRMIQCIYQEEKSEPLAFIIRKMVGHESKIPYHLDVLLTQLWNEFNYYAASEPYDKLISFFDALKIIQDYLSPDYQAAGEKLTLRLKPESLDYEDFLILILKNILTSHEQDFLLNFESGQILASFLINQCKVFINPVDLETFFGDVSKQSSKTLLRFLNLTVSKVDESIFVVKKSEFFYAVVDIFDEFLLQGKLEVEKRIRSIEEITTKDFETVLKELGPDLDEKYIKKIMDECSIDEASNLYSVSRESFAEVVIKYGIGGLGVGPFRTKELRALLERYLRKDEKVNYSRRQSSDLVPYKISIENVETPVGTSQQIQHVNIMDILPSKNIKLHNIRKAVVRTPSPSPDGRSKQPAKFFNSRSSSPFRIDSPIPQNNSDGK